MLIDYLKYLLKSNNRHSVHSPFIYKFNESVLNARLNATEWKTLHAYIQNLKENETVLEIEDLGSGSKSLKKTQRKVKDIYKTASSNRRMMEILFQIVRYYQCKNILEIGTCLGVGTAAMQNALGNSNNSKINTIEGSKELRKYTSDYFNQQLKNNQVNFIEGNFDSVLPNLLPTLAPLDLVFIDGNHSYEATIRYFEMLLSKVHNESIFIFDDIYWSEGMKKAWNEIQNHPSVQCTVDIFRWGIVFFRKEMQKEHFTIRFYGFLEAHIS